MSDPEGPTWRVVYSDGFARRILKYLTERIDGQPDPRAHGHALTGPELGGLWRYRIGNYRVITELTNDTCTVLALRVGHRSTIYR